MEEKKKVWIRGRKGRGSEIHGILIGLGATDAHGMRCENEDAIYFINHKNKISCAYTISEVSLIIMDNYKEIKLPRQEWKDGDMLICDKWQPESKEPEEKKTGKASGADAIVLDKADKNFVFTGTFKADRIKREGSIGKRSYYSFPNGVEAEDVCRYLPFNLGNVVKYVCRAGRKDPKKKALDLQKAMDYLENEIKRMEEEDD